MEWHLELQLEEMEWHLELQLEEEGTSGTAIGREGGRGKWGLELQLESGTETVADLETDTWGGRDWKVITKIAMKIFIHFLDEQNNDSRNSMKQIHNELMPSICNAI